MRRYRSDGRHQGWWTRTDLPSIVVGRSRGSVANRQADRTARRSSNASASETGALIGAPPEPGALAELRFHRFARSHR